ncbi:MAG: YitT family protein [Anaerolineae bacterium]
MANSNWRAEIKNFLLITSGALMLIVSIDAFLAPANISPGGGVTGLSLIINHFTGLPIGRVMLILNIPLLILGFKYLGRFHFLARTLYTVAIYNLGVDFLGQWVTAVSDDLMLNVLFGGVIGGFGMGLIFRGRSTTAGFGVISRIVQLKTGMPISQVYILTDGVVLIGLGLTFGWVVALYSLVTLFIWGLATDYALEGPSVVRTVFIVTDKPQEIANALFERLGVGITGWQAQGMYTKATHMTLFCTVNRSEVNSLRVMALAADPMAFIVIGQGHQTNGGIVKAQTIALPTTQNGEQPT